MNYGIVGLGAAGVQAATAIRERDAEGEIRIFSAEPEPFYYRASLPYYALGKLAREQLQGRPDGFFEAHRIQVIHRRVAKLDADARTLETEGGEVFRCDRILVACGAAPLPAGCEGEGLRGIQSLGTLRDADAVRDLCREGGRTVIAGGGAWALPMAHVARRLGMEVTLLVPEPQVGRPWLDARGGQILFRRLVEDGVDVRLGEGIARISGEHGHVAAVRTTAGKGIACKWVGVGLGGRPRTGLAAEAGLTTEDGMLQVGDDMATSAPGIYAAGDGCEVWDGRGGCHRYAPGWDAASLQGHVAGANMAGGREIFDPSHCYHATVLYDLPLTLIGRFDACGDADVCSSPSAEEYRHLVFEEGRLIGATLLGDRRHSHVLRRIVELGVEVRRYELQLLRTDVDLNRLLRPSGEYHLY